MTAEELREENANLKDTIQTLEGQINEFSTQLDSKDVELQDNLTELRDSRLDAFYKSTGHTGGSSFKQYKKLTDTLLGSAKIMKDGRFETPIKGLDGDVDNLKTLYASVKSFVDGDGSNDYSSSDSNAAFLNSSVD